MARPEHDAPEAARPTVIEPRPSPLTGPATVADCARDYEAGAGVRAAMAKQQANGR